MWGVTLVALAMAVGMSIVAMRLLRGDRRPNAARVSALEAAAFGDEAHDIGVAFDDVTLTEPTIDNFREPTPAMFVATDAPGTPQRRWLALAGVATLMIAVIGGAFRFFAPTPLGATHVAPPPATHPIGPAPITPPTHDAAAIELTSLKYTADASTFSVAGFVQNPANGALFPRVIAVVYLFDTDGNYFATGRGDLEFHGLRPGEESSFTVTIPNTTRVGRYRVGFRRDDGSVIAHVDTRGHAAASSMTEGKQP